MTQTLSIRMDSELKKEFSKWCEDVGMNVSVAINMFAKATLRDRKLPFEVKDEKDPFYSEPNMKFLEEAVEALNAGKGIEHELIEAE